MSYLTTYTGKHFHFDDIESNVVDEGWSPEDARKSFLELFWQLTP
jgi:hypothetical protein